MVWLTSCGYCCYFTVRQQLPGQKPAALAECHNILPEPAVSSIDCVLCRWCYIHQTKLYITTNLCHNIHGSHISLQFEILEAYEKHHSNLPTQNGTSPVDWSWCKFHFCRVSRHGKTLTSQKYPAQKLTYPLPFGTFESMMFRTSPRWDMLVSFPGGFFSPQFFAASSVLLAAHASRLPQSRHQALRTMRCHMNPTHHDIVLMLAASSLDKISIMPCPSI